MSWDPKVHKMMTLWASFQGSGPVIKMYVLFGVHIAIRRLQFTVLFKFSSCAPLHAAQGTRSRKEVKLGCRTTVAFVMDFLHLLHHPPLKAN